MTRLLAAGLLAVAGLAVGCPTTGEPSCPEGQALDPESGACHPEECGVGEWGAIPRGGATIHVKAGASGGDGTEERPFGSVRAGVDAADGGLVAVAAGTYTESLRWSEGAHQVVGRCASLVTIDGTEDGDRPVLLVEDGTHALEGLTLRGSASGGVELRGAGATDAPSLTLTGVTVRETGTLGLGVYGSFAEVTGSQVSVVDMLPDGEGVQGGGVLVERGRLELTDLRIDGAGDNGIFVFGGEVELTDVLVTNVTTRADGLRGRGVTVREGARASFENLAISRVAEAGLTASSDSIVDVTGARVREVFGTDSGAAGFGFASITGGRLTVVDADVEGTAAAALAVRGEGSYLEVRESVVRRNVGGLNADDGGELVASDVVLEENDQWSVTLFSAEAQLTDVTVRRTRPGTAAATGVSAAGGSTLTATRLVVEDSERVGLLVTDNSAAVVTDSAISGCFSPTEDDRPAGVRVVRDSTLEATGLLVEDNESAGIEVYEGSNVTLNDVTVSGTQAWGFDGQARGVAVVFASTLVAQGLTVEGSYDIAVLASEPDTEISIDQGRIVNTRVSLTGAPGGAVAAQNGAHITLTNSVIEENEGAGVYFAAAGMTLLDTDLDRNSFAGVVCLGGTFSMSGGGIQGTTVDPAHGGGLGLFADARLQACDLTVSSAEFADLPAGAFHLRGVGEQLLSSNVIRDVGALPSAAAVKVLANPSGAGVVLAGNSFDGVAADAILLDGAGAELREDPVSGPNVFAAVSGDAIVWQRCGPDVVVLDESAPQPSCREVPRPLGPRLQYDIALRELDPVD
ncbi:MAG: right-handed parallel beta-helix repeat-containing protein [Deltaproteobacteria bacterium]|nr:right-handed parallel beta-helix repeat-containing protein [Deltaproteobacteria bacterium]